MLQREGGGSENPENPENPENRVTYNVDALKHHFYQKNSIKSIFPYFELSDFFHEIVLMQEL